VIEDLPAVVAVPLAIFLIGAAFYQRRHTLMGWTGFKEDRSE
jgi:hypothetical protein